MNHETMNQKCLGLLQYKYSTTLKKGDIAVSGIEFEN